MSECAGIPIVLRYHPIKRDRELAALLTTAKDSTYTIAKDKGMRTCYDTQQYRGEGLVKSSLILVQMGISSTEVPQHIYYRMSMR